MKDRKAPAASKDQTSETWNRVPWKKLEQHCFRIQKRIYRASQRGNQRAVHKLQKLLMKSAAARLLAVRRVTQENQGKKTAGVDGVKSVRPQARLVMATHIHPENWEHQTPKPVRRVWIPKPGKAERRPLGIPPMIERCKQALAKLALEPEWEAKFEPNSYGFRPGRSCHDAIDAIYISINQKPKYVLDADIEKCFDRISHPALLAKLQTFPFLRRVIKGWLKAGVIENGAWFPTKKGTPQGGVCSPLLANIALHGLEQEITSAFPALVHGERWKPTVVRYADDLVLLHWDKAVVEQVQQLVSTWLANMGLTLKPSKTCITHTLTPCENHLGFDFLGFHIQQFPVGKTHSGKGRDGRQLGFKTLITPSETAIKRHQQALKALIKTHTALPQKVLIKHLNAHIRGWSNYYSSVCAKRCFTQMDTYLFQTLWQWSKRRHPNTSAKWRAKPYWHPEQGKWQFATT